MLNKLLLLPLVLLVIGEKLLLLLLKLNKLFLHKELP